MKKLLISLVISVSVLPVLVQAEKLYKWVDKDGNVSYHQKKPRDRDKYKVEEKEFGQQTGSARRSGAIKARNAKHPITLYMIPKCAMCDLLRDYLKSKKLPYSEINVESNTVSQAELIRISGKLEVPVVSIGKGVVRGYSMEELNKQLREVGYLEAEEVIESGQANQ